MDFDQLLHKLSEDKGWTILYVEDDDLYKIQLQIPGDRFQDVFISFRKDEEGWYVAVIWSVIADVADFNLKDPVELLRFNWRHLYGSLAIKDDEVVLLQNQLMDEANWNEVGRAIHTIANTADEIEKQIYGDVDEH